MLSVFAALVIGFSAFLLVLTLYTQADTARLNDLACELEARITETENENELLEIRLLMSLGLEELERRALELGMQPLRPEQILVSDK